MAANAETFEFKSEARQLLDLMIHSLYANKDVFLRELISNASDALDKRRFEALTAPELMAGDVALEIRLETDPSARTLTIADTGIGMSRQEVIEHLGTIAKSGTKEFSAALKKARAEGASGEVEALIGQFGVGFYSAFIAAERVEVVTRRAGTEAATRFVSTGDGTYSIEDAERAEAGTTVTLFLREADPENNLEDYTQEWVLRQTVKKYSDFIQYPIKLHAEKREYPSNDEGNPDYAQEPTVTREWQTINSQKALWTRPQSEVERSEYNEFYKHISHDWTDPLDVVQIKAEGTLEYYGLLFVPSRAPLDLYYRDARWGLQLFVNRVLIMEECKELLPDYLRFVRGVVDSRDLSLNVSREVLQRDRRVSAIRKRLVKKVLDALGTLQRDEVEKFQTFWQAFGRVLKEGVVSDGDNRERIRDLLWFESSHTVAALEAARSAAAADDAEDGDAEPAAGTGFTTLADYVARMKPEQDAIYYITGESIGALQRSPHLEAFFARGYEVLYLTDAYDEIMLGTLDEYEGKPLKSVGKGEVELGDEAEQEKKKAELEARQETHKGLLEVLQAALAGQVKEVRLSQRLTSSPACLVGEEGDYSPHFRRLLERAGAQHVPDSKRVLEVNPEHPLFARLQARFEKDAADPVLRSHAELLYGQALLAEGSPLPDPVAFSRKLAELLVETL